MKLFFFKNIFVLFLTALSSSLSANVANLDFSYIQSSIGISPENIVKNSKYKVGTCIDIDFGYQNNNLRYELSYSYQHCDSPENYRSLQGFMVGLGYNFFPRNSLSVILSVSSGYARLFTPEKNNSTPIVGNNAFLVRPRLVFQYKIHKRAAVTAGINYFATARTKKYSSSSVTAAAGTTTTTKTLLAFESYQNLSFNLGFIISF